MDNPYTIADLERLKAAQRSMEDLGRFVDKGERCGVKCETVRAIAQQINDELASIEREWMSNPSELRQG
jgi:phage I-like protein